VRTEIGRISYFFRWSSGMRKPSVRRQLVIRIQRRGMARGAPFALENLLATPGDVVKLVRVRRRLRRIDVKRQRVKLFIAVAAAVFRVRKLIEGGRPDGNETRIAGPIVGALIERRVAHQVNNRVLTLQSRGVQVAPIFYTDQIGNVRRIKGRRAMPGQHAGRNPVMKGGNLGGKLCRMCSFVKDVLQSLSEQQL
jgi:hypothetical protein